MLKKITLLSLLFVGLSAHTVEEGMFPLSEISKIDLQKAGLNISTQEVYNPNGTSLVDALVRLGGCTGSFVSNKGLIITNHHCAFGSVAAISTKENNYLEEGFVAKDGSMEAKTGLTCRITKSYEDVSNKILSDIPESASPAERSKLIDENIKKLEKEESEANPDLTCEISEMFVGKHYTLFRYQVLTDVRLVYVPPRSIGEFGGETDNWVWPRHTGDFSFVRAYVAPDGTPREYHEDNVPFEPKKFLKVNPNGVEEDDFIFILGYPGRTYRHQPSEFIEYQRDFVLPFIADWFDWQINKLEELGRDDKNKELRFASRIKSLANVTKNFKGKMQGIDRTKLLQQKQEEDHNAQRYIENNPELNKKYGEVFDQMDGYYSQKLKTAQRDLWFSQLYRSSGMFFRSAYVAYYSEQTKNSPKGANKLFYKDKKDALVRHLESGYGVTDTEFDKEALVKLLTMAKDFDPDNAITALGGISKEEIPAMVDKLYESSKLNDGKAMLAMLKDNPGKLFKTNDKFIKFAGLFNEQYYRTSAEREELNNRIDALMPRLLEAKMEYNKKNFIPDANSTLRFTYGYVRGYSPQDAVYNEPFTSIEGLLEKASDKGDYFMPAALQQKIAEADNTRFVNKKMKTVPVGLLYNLDTTGGNSGSPILDKNGDLIGVNFDRAFTATINDYAWNEKYSRSIGVDIRYILFFLTEVAEADYLVEEMGVKM